MIERDGLKLENQRDNDCFRLLDWLLLLFFEYYINE